MYKGRKQCFKMHVHSYCTARTFPVPLWLADDLRGSFVWKVKNLSNTKPKILVANAYRQEDHIFLSQNVHKKEFLR